MARKPTQTLREAYGFDLPEEIVAFHDFVRDHPAVEDVLEFRLGGPFDVLAGKIKRGVDPVDAARFYRDPPELFTFASGNTDGLHWGYWSDDPPRSRPFVVSYYHSDSCEISFCGERLFDALRRHLEFYDRDAEGYLADDPGEPSYRDNLARYAELRKAIAEHGGPKSKARGDAYIDGLHPKRTAPRGPRIATRHAIGVAAPKGSYVPLPDPERWTTWNYAPTAKEIARDMARAQALAAAGSAGTALKLGHDLWVYRDFAAESRAMLSLAYDALDRPILRGWLDRAITWQRASDRKQKP